MVGTTFAGVMNPMYLSDSASLYGVLLVNGSSFDEEFGGGHFRTITLPRVEILAEAYDKLERFMIRHKA